MVNIKEMLSKNKNAAAVSNFCITLSVKEFEIVFLQTEILFLQTEILTN